MSVILRRQYGAKSSASTLALVLPDGRDGRQLRSSELFRVLKGVVPGLSPELGKDGLLRAYANHISNGAPELLVDPPAPGSRRAQRLEREGKWRPETSAPAKAKKKRKPEVANWPKTTVYLDAPEAA